MMQVYLQYKFLKIKVTYVKDARPPLVGKMSEQGKLFSLLYNPCKQILLIFE